MTLENKVAVVTGGASGFGAAFSRRFAREGARVVLADVADEGGEAVAASIRDAGGEAVYVHADVTRAADVEALVGAARERFGRLDILMNNAGIASPRVAIEDMDEALFDRLYAVNVKSIFLGCRHAVPLMRTGGGGVIINTASTSAVKPRPMNAGYASSKGAVMVWTRALAVELAADRIRVNALVPVAADTPLFRDFVGDDEPLVDRMRAMIPLGRLCETDDMAACAAFLASDEAAFLTGVCLPVDGGWTAG